MIILLNSIYDFFLFFQLYETPQYHQRLQEKVCQSQTPTDRPECDGVCTTTKIRHPVLACRNCDSPDETLSIKWVRVLTGCQLNRS